MYVCVMYRNNSKHQKTVSIFKNLQLVGISEGLQIGSKSGCGHKLTNLRRKHVLVQKQDGITKRIRTEYLHIVRSHPTQPDT